MPIEPTLTRAWADLDAGRVRLARKRLIGLVASFPERLELREALAEAYRRGASADHTRPDPAQVGRWSYLSPEPDPIELAAFEKAVSDPVLRMRQLKWRRPPEEASTESARRRLQALLDEARATGATGVTYENVGAPSWVARPRTWGDRVATAVFLLIGALVILGVLDGVRVVVAWITG